MSRARAATSAATIAAALVLPLAAACSSSGSGEAGATSTAGASISPSVEATESAAPLTASPTESARPSPPPTVPATPPPTATPTQPTASATATAQPTDAPPLPLAGPLPTEFVAVERSVKDPKLGHDITVTRIARGLPWPTGTPAAQLAAFELIGVEMRWTPGTKYTSAIRKVDLALITGSAFPNRPDPIIDAQVAAAGWALLPAELSGPTPATGWVIVKLDPKAATSIRLDYTRPLTAVTGTSTRFPKETFSVQIVG